MESILKVKDKNSGKWIDTPAIKGDVDKSAYDFQNTVQDIYTYFNENDEEISIPILKIGKYEFYTLSKDMAPEERII